MFDSWRKQAELFLGLVADAWAIVVAALIPPAVTPAKEEAQMRAVRISAVFVIVMLGLLLNTQFAGQRKIDTIPFALLTLVYFTIMSWLVAGARWLFPPERERDDLVATSLSLVIGFVALSIFVAALLREVDIFIRFPLGNFELRAGSAVTAVVVAAVVTLLRSYLRPTKDRPGALMALIVVAVLAITAGFYIFYIA
jgi:hypothetical protein